MRMVARKYLSQAALTCDMRNFLTDFGDIQLVDSDLTGATLGHFRLVARIGAGGWATVYRAFAGFAGEQQVAIKVLNETLTADEAFRDRFEKDVGLVSALGHPHLLAVHAHGTDQGVTYVATALAPGGSLRDLMRLGPVSPERSWAIVSAVAEALHRAHGAGLVHRDIKPGNVLFDASGRPLLADFGLAPTHFGFAVGTPAYMAPEQAMGGQADRRSDVYALAAVLFEMLTGRPLRPAGGSVAEQLRAAATTVPPRASEVVPSLPAYVDTVLQRALAEGPGDRYQSTVDLLHDLGLALGMHAALPPAGGGVTDSADEGRGRGEAEFERQRAQLLRVVRDSLGAAIALDESSFVVGWNGAAELTFGWRRDEIVGRLLSTTLIPARYQEAHERGFQRYLQGGEGRVIGTVVELTAMHRDGREVPIELSISPAVQWGSRSLVVGFALDVSLERRNRAIRAVRASLVEGLELAGALEDAGLRALEAIGRHLDWSAGALWLVDGGILRCAHVWKAEGVECAEFERATRAASLARGAGLPGRAWESAEALWVEDVLHEPEEARIVPALRAGLHCAVAIPIVAGLEVRGVLELLAAGPRCEDEDLLLRLGDIGRRVGRRAGAAEPAQRPMSPGAPSRPT
jgi:PAS domain S-box-containing protein